ncbi:beta-ketoacyl-[acyl-carrier-protein] synthase family protein [Pacificoceanicola onchidii]|uniref:beta-ketoacyl-[acyl-carrier-protein] synthase family protein n=1 Tax=Pacificoceanicola onchidii TaxID=2562685 RepID=UPI0010A675D3|nr:beta-ketoacyl-[acyl-carrier-protein] synthase family protein [Pacificoceanicola onchidii]
MSRSVVVTGLGVVARGAIGLPAFEDLLAQGGDAPDAPMHFDTSGFRARRAYAADPRDTEEALRQAERAGQLSGLTEPQIVCAGHGILAALEAIRMAGLSEMPRGVGCAVATTSGGLMDGYSDALMAGKGERDAPDLVTPASAAHVLSQVFDLNGPLCAFSCACVSSLGAMSYALSRVRNGDADIMIVGGSDRMRAADFAGFNALRAMDRETCRPFDRTRKGMMIGDGSAILVIEAEDHAKARGAEPIVRLSGMGLASDSHHITSPNPRGLTRAMKQALQQAGRKPSDISYVNCHGTGTPLNDAAEAEALDGVFTGKGDLIISSTKGTTGHLLGTAGAIEIVATILALKSGKAPPMLSTKDPEDVPFTLSLPEADRTLATGVVMKNSLGFGGLNGSLILELPDIGDL